ncbi:23S rRNA (adenine(1618)-N(6))-methyltransferase RlmF [Patiriisocius hiemis]|uniref:23S rRNA (Adenine(1618)-N(6))-methyltransferase RlmF n=1 Tax=Patiriisocius hiemis TaxID=3075604 RepID=A0ABU2Y9H8_9FLAO|nr:23S rRNA (adenine(1618)-N(6))-methyltransferase RlmF [Constantimarinum sp. W242]MDT0554839.1 23S rRNA (adenine(1618)-N(6))-methyltransferase RlmF [Constantimarinum sp. W242]
MHPNNPYQKLYDFKQLVSAYPKLGKFVTTNLSGELTIQFGDSAAVYALNKAILLADYKLIDYIIPKGYLIPPIPGRLDYLLHLQDFYKEKTGTSPLKVLDIGAGANTIYCILGAQHFNWTMVGAESDYDAVNIAKQNISTTLSLQEKIEIRHQENKSFLFKGIIKAKEQFDITVCNPPFHGSKEEALKGTLRKQTNLNLQNQKKDRTSNFEGQANELWCNGGETLFIKRLIKESTRFKSQVRFFSSLVAKASSLPNVEKQLVKSKANYEVLRMEQGNKISRCVVWWYN